MKEERVCDMQTQRQGKTAAMTWEKYRDTAEKMSRDTPSKGKARRVCQYCLDESKNVGEICPLFPSRYAGKCPKCGRQLRDWAPG